MKKILIDAKYPGEIRAILVDKNNKIEEIESETSDKEQIRGNIYLAKVSRIEPSLQAAFITYEDGKSGFLPFVEIHPDFFTLDQEKLANLAELAVPEQNIAEKIELSPNLDSSEVTKICLDSTDEEIDAKAQYQNIHQKYKIQDAIKRGQILIVQAQKEQRGTKSASFTTFLSLVGKFSILMPNTPKQNGISKRIVHNEERNRLKEIVATIVPNSQSEIASLIIRTAGADRSLNEIKKDYEYLVKIWNKIRNAAITLAVPNILHVEEEIIPKIIRDMLDDKVEQVIIQGHEQHKQAAEFVQQVWPSEVSKIIEHKHLAPIFTSYGLEEQLLLLYQPIVTLPSGGYLVINPTEALTSIDVNSGKATTEKHISETALKTNLEAASIIAEQLKLRDIAGLIVVDFIDMQDQQNRKILEQSFKSALSKDKARIHFNPISNLGLIEISRQRMNPSFLERNSTACKYCNGKGVVRSEEANSILIMRTIEKELSDGRQNSMNVFGHADTILYILNKKRYDISRIEQEFEVELNFYCDKQATAESFYIEKIKLQKTPPKQAKPILNSNKLTQPKLSDNIGKNNKPITNADNAKALESKPNEIQAKPNADEANIKPHKPNQEDTISESELKDTKEKATTKRRIFTKKRKISNLKNSNTEPVN